MGAVSFMTGGYGATAQEAYNDAVAKATEERGTDPYNGTISTTDGISQFRKISFEKDREIIQWLQDDENIFANSEKWGPARYFKSKDHEDLFYFFGIAAE